MKRKPACIVFNRYLLKSIPDTKFTRYTKYVKNPLKMTLNLSFNTDANGKRLSVLKRLNTLCRDFDEYSSFSLTAS